MVNLSQLSDVPLTRCTDGSYCCGTDNVNCCGSNLGSWLKDDIVYPHNLNPFLTTTSTTMSTSASSTSSTQTSSTKTSSPTNSQSAVTQSSFSTAITSSGASLIAIETSIISGSLVTLYAAAPTTSTPANNSGDHETNILAIELGAGLGGILIIGIIIAFVILCHRRPTSRMSNWLTYAKAKPAPSIASYRGWSEPPSNPSEMPAHGSDEKNAGSLRFQEMPA
jgi:hypothetical protein